MTRITSEGLRNRSPSRQEAPQANDTAVSSALPPRTGPLDNTRRAAATTRASKPPRNDALTPALFDPSKAFAIAPMPTGAELKEVAALGHAAEYSYYRDPSRLAKGYEPMPKLMAEMKAQLDLPKVDVEKATGKKNFDAKLDDTIVDPKTGTVTSLVANHDKRQIIVSVAGASAGFQTKSVNAMAIDNLGLAKPQYIDNNLGAAFGKLPDGARLVARLMGKVLDKVATDPRFEGYEVLAAAHSMGQPQALAAAVAQKQRVRVFGFGTAPPSVGGLAHGWPEHLAQFKQNVKCYAPTTDKVPRLGQPDRLLTKAFKLMGIDGPVQVGTHHFFDPDPRIGSLTSGRIEDLPGLHPHIQFASHLDACVERDEAATAAREAQASSSSAT